jgi:hypothetical protein
VKYILSGGEEVYEFVQLSCIVNGRIGVIGMVSNDATVSGKWRIVPPTGFAGFDQVAVITIIGDRWSEEGGTQRKQAIPDCPCSELTLFEGQCTRNPAIQLLTPSGQLQPFGTRRQ